MTEEREREKEKEKRNMKNAPVERKNARGINE
jgi:hypothetical protein